MEAGVTLKQAAASLLSERCIVSADVLEELNSKNELDAALTALETGSRFQIRISSGPGQYALYTVKGKLPSSETGTVRISHEGLARLGGNFGQGPIHAKADTQVVDIPPRGEFTEHLMDFGEGAALVIIAPHGGQIEEYTDVQAEEMFSALSTARMRNLSGIRCWTCKGFRAGGGAFNRWHITSTDISENSFPKLKTIMRPWTYAVSFHGFEFELKAETDDRSGADVLLGGLGTGTNAQGTDRATELRLLQGRIQAALQATHGGLRVKIAGPDIGLGSKDPRNIVNRLSTCGLQIEQTPAARQKARSRIAQVVADTFISALRDGLVDPRSGTAHY